MPTRVDIGNSEIPLERMEVCDVLARIEPFAHTRSEDLDDLVQVTARIRRPPGSVIVQEGGPPDGLYVLLRGRVNLVRLADAGRDLILGVLGAGDVFGESCACDGASASTSAVSAVPCELLRIPADAIAGFMKSHSETCVRLLRLMHDKLREAENVASGLALCDVEERLRRTLARLAMRQGRKAPSATGAVGWILAPVPTQSELANMVGSCRETVSRTLSAMARSGLVTPSGRRLIVDERLLASA